MTRVSTKIIGTAMTLALLAGGALAHAQTTTGTASGTAGYSGMTSSSSTGSSSSTTGTSSTTPGAPNTGAGGNVQENLLLLAASGLVALAGATYLTRKGALMR